MNKLNITPGKWIKDLTDTGIRYIRSERGEYILTVHGLEDGKNNAQKIKEADANFDFIAEAGTVYNATGMTPKELVEQNKKLTELLELEKEVSKEVSETAYDLEQEKKQLLNLLKKAVQDHSEKFEEPHLDAWYNEAKDLIKKSEQS